MKPGSLSELFAAEKAEIVHNCDLCGLCVEVCPAIPLTPLASVPPSEIQEKIIDVFKNGTGSEVAAIRAASCMRCANCSEVCPQGLNPLDLQEILQTEMVKLGQKRFPRMEIKLGEQICLITDVLASLQMKPEEQCWLTRVPDVPRQKDIVFFTGCGWTMMPDKMFLMSDIFTRLKLDFVMLAGGELCCGSQYLNVSPEKADACNHALVQALNTFKPRKGEYACPECYYLMTHYDTRIHSLPFENEELFYF